MTADPEHIRNWQRLGPRITTSGQPREGEIDSLAALGIARVINLGLHSHADALPDEAASLAARGIAYTHIPVPFDAPEESHFAAFRAALEAEPGAVHVHCIMNYRVSAFFYRYHRDHCGMAEAEARALMEMQWSPGRSDRPETVPWANFIADRREARRGDPG